MNKDDLAILGSVAFFLILCGVAAFVGSYRSEPAVSELTETFSLPGELSGCRVYRLSPKGVGETLYVVAREGQPITTSWMKSRRMASVSVLEK